MGEEQDKDAFLLSWYYLVEKATFQVGIEADTRDEFVDKAITFAFTSAGYGIATCKQAIDAFNAREAQATLGIGKGVVIICDFWVDALQEDFLCGWCVASRPVPWNSLDGKPIRLAVIFIYPRSTPKGASEVLMCRHFSLIHCDGFRKAALGTRTAEELKALVSDSLLEGYHWRREEIPDPLEPPPLERFEQDAQ